MCCFLQWFLCSFIFFVLVYHETGYSMVLWVGAWTVNGEGWGIDPPSMQTFASRFLLHLHPPANSALMSTLSVGRWNGDERTGLPSSCAEAKTMKSLTLHTYCCLRARLRASFLLLFNYKPPMFLPIDSQYGTYSGIWDHVTIIMIVHIVLGIVTMNCSLRHCRLILFTNRNWTLMHLKWKIFWFLVFWTSKLNRCFVENIRPN